MLEQDWEGASVGGEIPLQFQLPGYCFRFEALTSKVGSLRKEIHSFPEKGHLDMAKDSTEKPGLSGAPPWEGEYSRQSFNKQRSLS